MVNNEIIKLKFDNSFNGRLFAVQGDTGRVFNLQVFDDFSKPVDVTSMKLRMYVANSKEVSYSEGEIVEAAEGKIKVQVYNSQLKYPGKQKAQFILTDVAGQKIGSKIFDLWIEEGLEAGPTVGRNIYVDFEKINEALDLIKDYDKTLEEAKEVDASLKVGINEGIEARNNLADCKKKALEIKGQLDNSKVDANKTLGDLNKTKTESESLKSSLSSENQKATENISDLSGKIETGKATSNELNTSIEDAKVNKENLDKSNTTALAIKKSLEDVTSAAKTTETDLSNLKNSGGTLYQNLSTKITEGSNLKPNLDTSISDAATAKSNLDASVEEATSTNTTLKATDTEAKKTEALIKDLMSQLGKTEDEVREIIVSGDLSKYVTDPKLQEALKSYATKEDLSSIDVTGQLVDYAKKTEIPTKLSQLDNDKTFKTESEIQAMINNSTKLKKEVVTSLPPTGKEDIIYLLQNKNDTNNFYTEYLWIGGKWEIIGDTKLDLTDYAKKSDLKTKLSEMTSDSTHRTVTDDEKTNWNEKLSTVAGKDITKGQTKGYGNTKTWEVVSRSRELGEWIGDLDARTRSLNKESIKTVNGLRPDASGNLKLVIDPYPTDPVVGFNVKSGTNSFELTWTNPKNLDFEGVKIVKNYEHYPANVDDGIEVLDSYGSKNTQKFTDTKIRKGMYTYYRIFPFDYHRNYNMDSGQVGTGLIKDEQEPPSPPTLKEASYETVTLNSVVGIEFSIDGSRWQTSNVFNNLNSNTSYTFYARKAGTTFLNPSPKSAGLTVKTKIPFDDKIGSPGNRKLLKGTMEQGWFGEVSASDFISGDGLAKKVGITAGTSQNSNGGWLKFAYMGKVEFVAKKTIRYGISWDSINSANAVTGQRTIDIGGKTYKIRLMKGKTEGKQNDSSSYEGSINKGSEWNRLMLPIHQKAPSNWSYKDNVNSPTENWNVGYTDNDLFTTSGAGNGSCSWCQEYGESTSYRLVRGGGGVSYSSSGAPSGDGGGYGWRPVLELVR